LAAISLIANETSMFATTIISEFNDLAALGLIALTLGSTITSYNM